MTPEALGERAVEFDQGRRLVFEPDIKAHLRARGIPVPAGFTTRPGARPIELPPGLREPFVVKAFGQRIVHKSELGAVRLGVTKDQLDEVAAEFQARLGPLFGDGGGLLIEEQVPAGVELLIGIVVRSGLPVVVCGLGGVLAEAMDDLAVRVGPITRLDAEAMLGELRIGPLLGTTRAPLDRAALCDLLVQVAGAHGILDELLSIGLLEFECNPVILGVEGAILADARLLLAAESAAPAVEPPAARDLSALFSPESIGLVGVSTSGKGMGSLSLEAYRRLGWQERLFVVHPRATSFGSIPAVASLAEVPGGRVDYLKVMLPAADVPGYLATEGMRAGVVQVVSDGFSRPNASGGLLADDLLGAVRQAETTLIGPNCIGVYCVRGGQTYELGMPSTPGEVAVVSQSGGVSTDVIRIGFARGLRFSKVCSVGNGLDVSPAEMLEYLVEDPDTCVIGLYLEGIDDPHRLVRALRAARGRVPVVMLMAGLTGSGSAATTSHTGALATDVRLLEALSASTGAIIAMTLDEFLADLLALQQFAKAPLSVTLGSVLVAGHGGGHTALVGDACERAGLFLPRLDPATRDALVAHPLGVQKSLVNPLEVPIGPLQPPETLHAVLGTVLEHQPFSDVLIHFSARSFSSEGFFDHGGDGLAPLLARLESLREPLANWPRISLVARATEVVPETDRQRLFAAAADAGLCCYLRVEDAVAGIRSVQAFERLRQPTA